LCSRCVPRIASVESRIAAFENAPELTDRRVIQMSPNLPSRTALAEMAIKPLERKEHRQKKHLNAVK
jgi:hypothetical protein